MCTTVYTLILKQFGENEIDVNTTKDNKSSNLTLYDFRYYGTKI